MIRYPARRIAILGRGFVGTNLGAWLAERGHDVRFLAADVRDAEQVRRGVSLLAPDVVMNCTGKTDIDWCEQNRPEACAVNVHGADHVARASAASGALLVHVSSGCLQSSSGGRPMHEEEAASPRCYYTWTKLWGEERVVQVTAAYGLRALILRPRLIVSAVPSARNTLVKLLTYRKFIDTPNSCTVLEDMAPVVDALIACSATGVFNVVNPGAISPYCIAGILGIQRARIPKDELDRMTLAKRADAVLSVDKLHRLGIRMDPIERRLPVIARLLYTSLRSAAGAESLARAAADTSRKLDRGSSHGPAKLSSART